MNQKPPPLSCIKTCLAAAALACAFACSAIGTASAEKGSGGGGGGGGTSSGGGGTGSGSSRPSDAALPGDNSPGSGKSAGSLSQGDQALVRKAVANGDAQSLGSILPAVHRAAPGKILDVSFDGFGGGYIYKFTVLTDAGRYVDVSVNAKTGTTIAIRGR